MSVNLWREGRGTPIGTVELDEGNRRLFLHIDDEVERSRIERVFSETGRVIWGWTRYGDNEWQEHRAEPLTSNWFSFLILNRLYPLGYRAEIVQGTPPQERA